MFVMEILNINSYERIVLGPFPTIASARVTLTEVVPAVNFYVASDNHKFFKLITNDGPIKVSIQPVVSVPYSEIFYQGTTTSLTGSDLINAVFFGEERSDVSTYMAEYMRYSSMNVLLERDRNGCTVSCSSGGNE